MKHDIDDMRRQVAAAQAECDQEWRELEMHQTALTKILTEKGELTSDECQLTHRVLKLAAKQISASRLARFLAEIEAIDEAGE